jgi:hypothetical protein
MIRNYAELLEVAEAISVFYEARSHNGGMTDSDYVLWAAAEGMLDGSIESTPELALYPDDEEFEARLTEVEEYVFCYADFVGATTPEDVDVADKSALCQKIAGLELAVENLHQRIA